MVKVPLFTSQYVKSNFKKWGSAPGLGGLIKILFKYEKHTHSKFFVIFVYEVQFRKKTYVTFPPNLAFFILLLGKNLDGMFCSL